MPNWKVWRLAAPLCRHQHPDKDLGWTVYLRGDAASREPVSDEAREGFMGLTRTMVATGLACPRRETR
jgi:hypothetical protein